MNNESKRQFVLRPIDAWFFRDGHPYNERESNQTGVESVFPPSPQTVVGAIRAALARSQGWSGRSHERWSEKLQKTLGDGFDNLGPLRFTAPLPARLERVAGQLVAVPLFPIPLHVVGSVSRCPEHAKPIWTPKVLLAPGKALVCDQGEMRLPAVSGQGLKTGDGRWITMNGLERILAGEPPDEKQIVSSEALWKYEYRIGLARGDDTRTAEEGMLYSPVFIRPQPDTVLSVTVSGLPSEWSLPELIAFGGEGRMAKCEPVELIDLHTMTEDSIRRDGGRLVVVLLSPLCWSVGNGGVMKGPGVGDFLPGLEGARIISACVGKPIRIGGWNSLKNEPLPLRPYLPAGSVFFCQCDAAIDSVLKKHDDHIGELTAYGFGHIAVGAWPNRSDSQ